MAAKKTAPRAPRTRTVAQETPALIKKINTAREKGIPEQRLLGARASAAKREALEELRKDLAFTVKQGTAPFWFATAFEPAPAVEKLRAACEAKGPGLWTEAALRKCLPAFYTGMEVIEAVDELRKDGSLVALRDGRQTKLAFLPHSKHPRAGSGSAAYFVSEAAALIYALVELEGAARQKALGLTPAHYRDAALARRWRNEIARQISPDVCPHPKAHDAAHELHSLYASITGEG